MRVLRVVSTIVVTAGIVGVLGAGPARAGGASSFEFDENLMRADYLVVGQFVTGTMPAYFEDRGLEGEQFYAYLEPVDRAGGSWRNPPRLSPAARPLGPISVGRYKQGCCGGYVAEATIKFTVPDVAPGQYVIEYCNRPCTEVFGAPDNQETWVEVVASTLEARLRHRIDRLDSNLRSAMWNEDRWERNRIKNLSSTVNGSGGVVSDTELARSQGQTTLRRVAQLEDRIEGLRARLDDDVTPWPAYALVALVLAGLAVIVVRTNHKPVDVNVSLIEQDDPTSREWRLVSGDDSDRAIWGPK